MPLYTNAIDHKQSIIDNLKFHPTDYIRFFRTFSFFDNVEQEIETIAALIAVMESSECFYWSDKMLAVAQECAKTVPTDTKLSIVDFPVHIGFFSFESVQRVYICDSEDTGEPLYIDVSSMMWGVSSSGLYMCWWGNPADRGYDKKDQYPFFCLSSDPQEVSSATMMPAKNQGSVITVLWPHLLSMILLLNQKFIVHETRKQSRAERRRIEKTSGKAQTYEVVYLRKPDRAMHSSEAQTEHKHIDWQYQWAVRGHWRKQPYRSTGTVKPIWINPYVKGPEDKPLVHTEKLFAVVR